MSTLDTAPKSITQPACDHQPKPYSGPSRDEVLADRQKYCTPALLTYYKEPIMIVEGHKQWLFDETGRRYLDGFAGIVTVSVGHCHPKVNAALKEQIDTLQHTTTIYLHPNIVKFAKKLASKMPQGLDVTYFVNSGSEANELAVSMARYYTGNYDMIALRNSYHGGSLVTQAATSHWTWKFQQGNTHGFHHALNPDPSLTPFDNLALDEIAAKSAADIDELIRYSTPGKVAGFIAEPIQGVGGTTHGDMSYLGKAYDVVRKYGGLCIADEVQTGFGRTGEHYWGFQNYGVTPDMVTMAKGIGNGFPLGAVTTSTEIATTMKERIHFNTYGGNPMACAAGAAVLDVIDEEGLQENCKVVGGHLKSRLEALKEKHAIVYDVRGMGLMLGMELRNSDGSPAKEQTAELLEGSLEHGLLIGKGGLNGNVVRLKPPMCLTKEDADFIADVFDTVISSWK
jgi:alanine-glyoxylate transaminase/(R)-3-amino-2-methylpropionate-pyruvate transaminase